MELYLTYDEYKSLGGELTSDIFFRLGRKAQNYLNYITFDRIKDVDESVKYALFECIEILGKSTSEPIGDISMYSNGVETISYRGSQSIAIKKEMLDAVGYVLSPKLLYRGATHEPI